MKLHMYEHFPNYGDMLNKLIWPRYFEKFLQRQDDILMFGIGTLLGQTIEHRGQVIVCGSGCGYEPDVEAVKHYKVFFVRGPHSARLLELPPETAITDPAILVDECLPPAPKRDCVVFMPHWETSRNPLWRRVCAMAGIEYIDPLADAVTISSKIGSAKLVIAEAMHGVIVADAYRVPWIPVYTSTRINLFKWHDWAASLNVRLDFRTLSPIGISDVFRSLTGDAKTAEKLRRAMQGRGDVPAVVGKGPWAHFLHGFNLLYNNLVPRNLRYRIEYKLLWKLGPRLDGWVDRMASRGRRFTRLDRVAMELRQMALEQGLMSDAVVHDSQKMRIKAKIEEVRDYLEEADASAA